MSFQLAACAELLQPDKPIAWRASRLYEMGTGVSLRNWPDWNLDALEKTGGTFTIFSGSLHGRLADEEDVIFTSEKLNLREHTSCPFKTVADVLPLVAAVKRPEPQIILNLCHTQIGKGDVIRWIETCLPWVGETQVADNPGRFEPGTGEMNWLKIAWALHYMGYEGPDGMEALDRGDPEEALEAFRKAFTVWTMAGIVKMGPGEREVHAKIALSELGHADPVTLLRDETSLPYGRPPLSLDLNETPKPIRPTEAHDVSRIECRFGSCAPSVDPRSQTARASNVDDLSDENLFRATCALAQLFSGLEGCLTLRADTDAAGIPVDLTQGGMHRDRRRHCWPPTRCDDARGWCRSNGFQIRSAILGARCPRGNRRGCPSAARGRRRTNGDQRRCRARRWSKHHSCFRCRDRWREGDSKQGPCRDRRFRLRERH